MWSGKPINRVHRRVTSDVDPIGNFALRPRYVSRTISAELLAAGETQLTERGVQPMRRTGAQCVP